MVHNFMTAFGWLILILIQLEFSMGQRSIPQPALKLNGSELVDRVLDHVRKRILARNLDPMVMPNLRFPVLLERISLRNGKITGLSNIRRNGPVGVNVTLRDTKFRSGFSVTGVTANQDVAIKSRKINYPNGRMNMECENVTGYQVFKLNHLSQALTLDEFEIKMGDFKVNATGLGDMAQKGSKTLTSIVDKTKDPLLKLGESFLPAMLQLLKMVHKNFLDRPKEVLPPMRAEEFPFRHAFERFWGDSRSFYAPFLTAGASLGELQILEAEFY